MNTSSLDLRLLLVFNTLMTEGSVTRAARKLGLTQPAISNALRRLRDVLGDELFRRSGDGMRPTPRAYELATPVSQVLRQFEAVFQPPDFVPEQSDRSFRIAVSPPVAVILLPILARRLHAVAPGISLRAQSGPTTHASVLLDSQSVDMIVGAMPTAPARFPRRVLYQETYVAMLRTEHPLAHDKLSPKQFMAADHLLVSQTQQEVNLFDDIIGRRGLKRTIRMRVTDWLTGMEVLAGTDLVTAVFKRTGEDIVRRSQGRLTLRSLSLPAFEVIMFWHDTFSRHPAYEWLQNEIVAAVAPTDRPAAEAKSG